MNLITDLTQVVAGTRECRGWGQDVCSFSSEQDLTRISYDFDEHKSTIPTAAILQLLQDWLVYLRQHPQPA